MQIDPRTLIQLTEIIERQSFSLAANELGTTQPGLSKAVTTLEKRLNSKLLSQRRRPVLPTELGRRLAEIGAIIRAANADANVLASEIAKGRVGQIRVGAASFFCEGLLTNIIHSFRKIYPGVSFDIVPGYVDELSQLVHQNRLDVAFGAFARQQDRLHLATNSLVELRHAIVCSADNPLRQVADLSVQHLREVDWISHSQNSLLYEVMREGLAAIGLLDVKPIVTSESSGFVVNMLRRSHALTVLPILSITDHLEAGDLAVLPYPIKEPKIKFGIITRRNLFASSIMTAFKSHAATFLADHEIEAETYLGDKVFDPTV